MNVTTYGSSVAVGLEIPIVSAKKYFVDYALRVLLIVPCPMMYPMTEFT